MNKKEEDRTTETKENIFFPDKLRGKKLRYDGWLGESEEPLKKYLMTEKPEFLFQAMKVNLNRVLQGQPDYSIKQTEFVDAHTIVWVTIYHWQWVYLRNRGNEEIGKEAEKLLMDVGRALIPSDVEVYEETNCGDFFVHIVPKWKGSHEELILIEPYKFIEYWATTLQSFKNGMKKRYGSIKKSDIDNMPDKDSRVIAMGIKTLEEKLRIEDIKNIIENNFGDEISEHEIKSFKLSSKPEIAASYIAWKNEKSCSICKQERDKRKRSKVRYRKILEFKKEAELFIEEHPKKESK